MDDTFAALMRLIQASDDMATETSSEICQVEQGRRAFPTKAVMLGMCVGIAVGVSVTLAITQMPAASHSSADDALIEFAEAKKKQIQQKGKSPPQSRRVFTGNDAELRKITVLRQFWVPMLFKKHDICRLPEEV